jgi:hypothetical protein
MSATKQLTKMGRLVAKRKLALQNVTASYYV